jgi:hypothetical protein
MIHTDNTGFGPGTIVLAAATQPRFYEFLLSMERLKVPAGTRWLIERGCDITQNFNDGVKRSTGEWIWFMGDDHAFSDDMLLRLLAWNKEVVIPPTPCKSIPFLPCIMHGKGSLDEWEPMMPLYTWGELTPRLMPLPIGDFIGQAGMLVKRTVFEGWPAPWFKAGQQDPGRLQEDMTFCRELQTRGYTIYVDCTQILDHYFPFGITARLHDGEWVPALDNNSHIAVLPDMLGYRTDEGKTVIRKSMDPIPLTLGDQTLETPVSRVTWVQGPEPLELVP